MLTCTTHTQPFAGGRGRHKRVATLATPSWLRRRERLPWKAGRQGGVAGLVGWRAGWGGGSGRVAGRVGWRAWWGGGLGGVAVQVGWRAGSGGGPGRVAAGWVAGQVGQVVRGDGSSE